MNNDWHGIEILSGDSKIPSYDIERSQVSSLPPFSSEIITFLDELSKYLLKSINIHQYPNITTFAFFCRRANLNQLKKKLIDKNRLQLGRGTLFHVAPSNVPINFAYSMVIGLLTGNSNIIKIPSKPFEEIDILTDAINKIVQKPSHQHLLQRNLLIRYHRSHPITEYLSNHCDVRIIWGGDETIQNIRQYPLKPRAYDITFADRYSLSVIEAKQFILAKQQKKIVNGFFNDTYLVDQNACTSTHLLIWIGAPATIKQAKQLFWTQLSHIVESQYTLDPIIAIDKLTTFCNQAIHVPNTQLEAKKNNLIWRVNMKYLNRDIEHWRCHGGYFVEHNASDLPNITKIITPKYQTLAYYGFNREQMVAFIQNHKPIGIDRIVPIGKTMDFSFTWDGFNLIENLCRTIEII